MQRHLLDDVANRYVDAMAALDPITATYLGIAGYENLLTDYSPEGFAARAELTRDTLTQLATLASQRGTDQDAVSIDAMQERLGVAIDLYDAGVTTSTLNVFSSPMRSIRSTFDLMPTATSHDWRAVADRLHQVPTALRGYQRTLTEACAAGQAPARRQIEACIEQCESWLPPASDFFGDLVRQANVDTTLAATLEAGAAAARGAFAEFTEFLRSLLPIGRDRDAVGRDVFALHARECLGIEIDLDEAYAWGWEELHRIQREIVATAKDVDPSGRVGAAVDRLDRDPARQIVGTESFLEWLQEQTDRSIAELDGTHFDIPEPLRTLTCRIAPTSDGTIYYTGPSEDLSRPGTMWWSVPRHVTTFSTWRELVTVYHEGVPGHHLQIGGTAHQTDTLNRWQRRMCWVPGHGEGWALYVERLMDELGFFSDPGTRLGMLTAQASRAIRVILDIGMHLELVIPPNRSGWHVGERWTPELGFEFLAKHSRADKALIYRELNRCLGAPARAASYKLGERIWLQARSNARERLGAGFSLKTFHDTALRLGSIGLGPFCRALDRSLGAAHDNGK
ncbi:MAG TPA: DUF885 domain-containing protein [Actinopolymorphaceae bacterium]|jgi:uncharacterized protein (DUF885 family)